MKKFFPSLFSSMDVWHPVKDWYRGKYIPYTIQELVDLQRPIYLEDREYHDPEIPDKFEPPLIARMINPICRFWLRHWKFFTPLIGFIAGAIALLFTLLFIDMMIGGLLCVFWAVWFILFCLPTICEDSDEKTAKNGDCCD